MSNPNRTHSRWTTKRMFFSLLGLGLATMLTYQGKLDGGNWVYALAIVIAGHHLEDVVKAWRTGGGDR